VPSDNGAVDHMLPVVAQTEIHQRFQQGVPHALLGPAAEPDIDRVSLAVAFMHVAPGTADPQHVEHAVDETAVVMGGAAAASAFGGQKHPDDLPFLVPQIASHATGLHKDQC
jgi:hypothetical protein